MHSWKIAIAAGFALVGLGTSADVASAEEDREDARERAALQQAKLTLAEAIAVAEKEVPGGKVIEAEVETENDTVSYAIEIEKNGVQTVLVDLQTGNVLKVASAKLEDEEDEEDDRPRRGDDDDDDEDED